MTAAAPDADVRALDLFWAGAWPAAETPILDGWRLRLDRGVTQRANSALPLGPSGAMPLDARIDAMAALYRARRLKPCVQISPAADPPELDDALEARGWRLTGATVVMTMPVAALPPPPEGLDLSLFDGACDRWLAAAFEGRDPEIRAAIVRRIALKSRFALLRIDGAEAAVGMLVWDGAIGGVSTLRTRDGFRRRGAARAILRALAAVLCAEGVPTLALQVEHDNEAAIGLYAAHGFRPAYSYWYRVAPKKGG